MTAIEDAREVRIQDAVPFIHGRFGDRLEYTNAGVVDQDVQAAELRHGSGHQRFHIGILAHVGLNGEHAAAMLRFETGGGGVKMTFARSADRDRGAVLQQRFCNRQADAA